MNRIDELDVVIRQKPNKVIAGIPQLRLYASGKNVSEALDHLGKKKKDLIEDLKEVGELDSFEIPSPAGPAAVRWQTSSSLKQFTLKTAIVIFLIGAAIIIPGTIVVRKLEKWADRTMVLVQAEKQKLKQLTGRAFWARVEAELDRAADPKNAIPEEKKQKLLANIRAIATQWRPFVIEAGALISAPPAAENQPSK